MSSPPTPSGPRGKPRGILFGVLIFVVTLGIYGLYWVYKTHAEMREHTDDGVGGILGLVIYILVWPVTAFVIPSEIGRMCRAAGQVPPLTGWTGLWLFPGIVLVVPAIVWFVKVQGALNRYWEGSASSSVAAGTA